MAEEKTVRLSQAARKLNVGTSTIVDFLGSRGIKIDTNPNTKITPEQYNMLLGEFRASALDKEEADELIIGTRHVEPVATTAVLTKEVKPEKEVEKQETAKPKLQGVKVVGKIDLDKPKTKKTTTEEAKKEAVEKPKKEEPVTASEPIESPLKTEPVTEKKEEKQELIEAKADTLKGLTVLGKIELPAKPAPTKREKSETSSDDSQKRKRVRIAAKIDTNTAPPDRDKFRKAPPNRPVRPVKEEITDKEIQDQIKATLARLGGSKGGPNRAKYRKDKRSAIAEAKEEQMLLEQQEAKVLKVTEFISANDLASFMNVSVNEVISVCMNLGMFVSINQRLDAEAITIIADELGYKVEFTTADTEAEEASEESDNPEDLKPRAPIVTIMGHVDHGKTSLLDYIRKTNIVSGEAGGITQHIGAYSVSTEGGKKITFLDTPGHEAFTAMRARGAKITDIVIIVVAADDSVMPQTREAINHAQVAGVPIVIAINKVDKPGANPDKIKEELANINILVEDWGGKYQCELVSAKSGQGVPELLEKVLLEAEILELKANPEKYASGTVIEAALDKGRGYVATVLVQTGTLKIGDILLAGAHYGRVKAMFDHRGQRMKEAGPSTPVQVLGLDGAPQAGDKFSVTETEREAREAANKREQLLREQSLRTKKHITLDEIGRRLAIGSFKELNVIVKGDVDGSVEALSDSLLKLSTEEVQVRIIHKAVGQISESDVLLASASDAVIVGFQVRPSASARKLAEQEEIEIRLYSVIYDAINEVKDAMEGMLAPTVEEVITANVEVREVFKISKVGSVAGCYVTDGTIKRTNRVRVVRDGIVVYTGEISALKRFKEDVGEVKSGYECGISVKNFNDIKTGDVIEAFEQKEVKRTL